MPSVSSSLLEDVHFSPSNDPDLTTSSLAPITTENAPLAQKHRRERLISLSSRQALLWLSENRVGLNCSGNEAASVTVRDDGKRTRSHVT